MLWKCSVCNYVHEGEEAPEKCPRCGAPREKFVKLEGEDGEKVERSKFTNYLHQELYSLLENVKSVSEEGIEDDLDPGCVAVFKKALEYSKQLQQMVMAEIETHVKKGKWG